MQVCVFAPQIDVIFLSVQYRKLIRMLAWLELVGIWKKEISFMMKLRHLFDNRDLAIMLLGNWEYDESSLEILNSYQSIF